MSARANKAGVKCILRLFREPRTRGQHAVPCLAHLQSGAGREPRGPPTGGPGQAASSPGPLPTLALNEVIASLALPWGLLRYQQALSSLSPGLHRSSNKHNQPSRPHSGHSLHPDRPTQTSQPPYKGVRIIFLDRGIREAKVLAQSHTAKKW